MDDINLPKRKYTKDNEEAAKRRAARQQGHEAPKGKLFYSCETMEEIQEINLLLQKVKTFLGGGNPNLCTNKQLLSEVFRFYIAKNIEEYGPEGNNTDSAELRTSLIALLPNALTCHQQRNSCLSVHRHQLTT